MLPLPNAEKGLKESLLELKYESLRIGKISNSRHAAFFWKKLQFWIIFTAEVELSDTCSPPKFVHFFCHPGCSAFAYTIPFRDPWCVFATWRRGRREGYGLQTLVGRHRYSNPKPPAWESGVWPLGYWVCIMIAFIIFQNLRTFALQKCVSHRCIQAIFLY